MHERNDARGAGVLSERLSHGWVRVANTSHLSRNPPCSRRPDHQPDAHAKPRQHVDQRIGAKQVDATTQEIADARLRDSKRLRCFCLLKTPRRDCFLNLNQQVRTDEEVLGFFLREPEIPEYIPGGRSDPNCAFLSHAPASTSLVRGTGRGRSVDRARSSSASSSRMREGQYRLCSRRHVRHAVCTGDVNPDLADTGADCLHRLPVVWIESLLHSP